MGAVARTVADTIENTNSGSGLVISVNGFRTSKTLRTIHCNNLKIESDFKKIYLSTYYRAPQSVMIYTNSVKFVFYISTLKANGQLYTQSIIGSLNNVSSPGQRVIESLTATPNIELKKSLKSKRTIWIECQLLLGSSDTRFSSNEVNWMESSASVQFEYLANTTTI